MQTLTQNKHSIAHMSHCLGRRCVVVVRGILGNARGTELCDVDRGVRLIRHGGGLSGKQGVPNNVRVIAALPCEKYKKSSCVIGISNQHN